ncbi:hypothetical protein SDJN03_26497, partial [Cucurbita argyrosperma subsp. sororia]
MAPIKSLISIALLALLLLSEHLPISAADHGVAPSPLAGVFRRDTLQTAERHQVAENGIGYQYSFEQKIRRRARRAVRRAEGPSPSSANWSRTSSFGIGSLLCLCTPGRFAGTSFQTAAQPTAENYGESSSEEKTNVHIKKRIRPLLIGGHNRTFAANRSPTPSFGIVLLELRFDSFQVSGFRFQA